MNQNIEAFIEFINQSPTAFHAVDSVRVLLEKNGFVLLQEGQVFQAENRNEAAGYFYIRNDSSLLAFRLPQQKAKGFHIMASHSDSPCFKLKTKPEVVMDESYVKLNVEKYGGMILSSWLDRPLGIAGRVITKENQSFVSHLVNLKDVAVIPNLAIHFNRDINKGFEYNSQVDMLPLISCNKDKTIKAMLAEKLKIKEEEILGEDLYLYPCQQPVLVGMDKELLVAPRLDDLQCAYGSLMGFLESQSTEYISVYGLFDNEEIGSRTRQGADSDFADSVLRDIWKYTGEGKSFEKALHNSFLVSADNAHALHPNHPEKSDITNKPHLNGGIVLKFNGNAHYTTDGFSQAFVTDLCKRADVPMQTFANRSDIAGGSTLGNIFMSHMSIPAADIGLGQLAMHSAVETAGVRDVDYMIQLSKIFYLC